MGNRDRCERVIVRLGCHVLIGKARNRGFGRVLLSS